MDSKMEAKMKNNERKVVTKSKLIKSTSEKLGLPTEEVRKIVNCFLDEIKLALKHNCNVNIRNFGVFSIRLFHGRILQNHLTKKPVVINDTKYVSFNARAGLKKSVRNNEQS